MQSNYEVMEQELAKEIEIEKEKEKELDKRFSGFFKSLDF